jgi:tetratricopeptide (TPR) repeat protein
MDVSQEALGHYNSGIECLRRRDYRQAVEELEKAIQLDPGNQEIEELLGQAYCSVGTYYYNRGMYNRAVKVLEKCLQALDYDDAHYTLACAYEKAGDYEKAIGEYRKAIEVDPEDGWNHKALGDLYVKMGEPEKAPDEYKKANELYPGGYAEARHNLLAVYTYRGMYEEAVSGYREFIERNPLSARAHNNLGLIYAKKGDRAEAEREYKRAFEIKDDYADPHYNLGVLYFREGRYDEAVSEFEKVLKINPNHAKAHLSLALTLEREGDTKAALRHYRGYIGSFRKPDDETLNKIKKIRKRVEMLEKTRFTPSSPSEQPR